MGIFGDGTRKRAEFMLQPLAQGGLSKGAGEDRNQGDADLHGREKSRRIGFQLDRRLSAWVTGLGERYQARLARRDERDLGHRKDAVDEDQQEDDREVQGQHRNRLSRWRPRTGAPPSVSNRKAIAQWKKPRGQSRYLSKVVSCAPSSATKTASRLAGSTVLAFSLIRCSLPGGSEKALTCLVDLRRPSHGIFGPDRARQHIHDNAAGVVVPCRFASRGIADQNGRYALPRDIRQLFHDYRLHLGA